MVCALKVFLFAGCPLTSWSAGTFLDQGGARYKLHLRDGQTFDLQGLPVPYTTFSKLQVIRALNGLRVLQFAFEYRF